MIPPSLCLLDASSNDIIEIQNFFLEELDQTFPEFSPLAKQAYAAQWGEKQLQSRVHLGRDLLAIVRLENSIKGIVSGTSPEGGVGTIVWLLVAQNARGLGIGKKLLNYAKQYYVSQGCHKIKLTSPSQSANNFYKKQGMILEGYHPHHWYHTDFWAFGQLLSSNAGE